MRVAEYQSVDLYLDHAMLSQINALHHKLMPSLPLLQCRFAAKRKPDAK